MRWSKFPCLLMKAAAIFALPAAVAATDLSLQVNRTETPPVIDGILENLWHQADSAHQFIQYQPFEGEPLSEPTVAYFLQDDKALYIAFRCETNGRKPDCISSAREGQVGDVVIVYFDTFFDRRNAYMFSVNCAGVPGDATISANGAEENISWDGVFASAALADSTCYVAEMAIPWSTFRFDKNATVWGVNLERRIPRNEEIGYFAPVGQDEAFTVSNFADLVNVHPAKPSKGWEFFPRGFYRTEKSYGVKSSKFQPAADINWSITSEIRLQSTINPDFSQVEADPYAINLSKYALYFDEQRPFFTEGQEYFKPSGSIMADQFELFYSRQIGKKLPDGSEAPLEVGARIIGKVGKVEFGSLACKTGKQAYEGWYGPAEEPPAVYLVDRLNYQPFTHTTVGMLYAGKLESDYRADVISIDGSTKTSRFEFTYQVANSYLDGKSDWAFNSYLSWKALRNFIARFNAQRIGDEFDVSEIGFVPWNGSRNFSVSMGPVIFPRSGPIKYGAARIYAGFSREFQEEHYTQEYDFSLEASLRNGWGLQIGRGIGREYELDKRYNPMTFSANVSTDMSRRFRVMSSYYTSHGYNYRRGYFARSESVNMYASLQVSTEFSLSLSGGSWIEHKPDGTVEEATYRLRPTVYFSPTTGMSFSLYEETPIVDGEGVLSVRIGLAFMYNFLPKSWIYVAYNDYQWRRSEDGVFEPQIRVFALKVKHLIAW